MKVTMFDNLKSAFAKPKPESSILQKRGIPSTTKMVSVFMVFFACSIFVAAVMAAASDGESWKYMLFHKKSYTDMYMDFFNSIRDGGSDNVYSERNNIYPPLCVLIFRIMSKMIDPSLVSTSFYERLQLQSDQLCMILYILFALICIMSMLRLIESYANIKTYGKMKLQAAIISFASIICYPVMFCLERGNILILSVVFAMFFMFFKDSENKIIREISYISLAFSAGIKLYPAIFGLSLIIEKKYKDAVRLMIYGIVVVALPIVFFLDEFKTNPAAISGFMPYLSISNSVTNAESSSAFIKLIKNLLNFAINKKTNLNFSSVSIQNIVFILGGSGVAAKIACASTEVLAIICAFNTKSEWKKAFLLCYLMLNIPSASNSYALTFLLIPFCIFLFGTKEYKRTDWIYLAGYTLLFTPLPTLWYFRQDKVREFISKIPTLYYNDQLNQNIATFVFQFMFFFLLFQFIYSTLKETKKQKKAKVTGCEDSEEIPQNCQEESAS